METGLARDLMSDVKWAFHERSILAARAPNGREPTNHPPVLDTVLFWMVFSGSLRRVRRGAPVPGSLAGGSSVYSPFRRQTRAGLREQIMEALNESGLVPDALHQTPCR